MGQLGEVGAEDSGSLGKKINPAMPGKSTQRFLIQGIKGHDTLQERNRHFGGDCMDIVFFESCHFFSQGQLQDKS